MLTFRLLLIQMLLIAVYSISNRASTRLSRLSVFPLVSRRNAVLSQQQRRIKPQLQETINSFKKSMGMIPSLTAEEMEERDRKNRETMKRLLPKMMMVHNHYLEKSHYSWVQRRQYIVVSTDNAWTVTLHESESEDTVNPDVSEQCIYFTEKSMKKDTKRRFTLSPITKKIQIIFYDLEEDQNEPFAEIDGTLTIFLRPPTDKVIGFAVDRFIQSIVPDE